MIYPAMRDTGRCLLAIGMSWVLELNEELPLSNAASLRNRGPRGCRTPIWRAVGISSATLLQAPLLAEARAACPLQLLASELLVGHAAAEEGMKAGSVRRATTSTRFSLLHLSNPDELRHSPYGELPAHSTPLATDRDTTYSGEEQ